MSSSASESDTSVSTKLKNLNLTERPRLAKKSTFSTFKFQGMTRRQMALASKDRLARLNSEGGEGDDQAGGREKRQRGGKRATRRVPGAAYDAAGVHVSGADLCDCLQDECPGCHFPCGRCASPRCGVDCRANRKYVYEQVEYHGYEFTIVNPLFGQ